MFYKSTEDLPVHCLLNLPTPALQVYKDAFNRAWTRAADHGEAQKQAWLEVRSRFERDALSGPWVAGES